MARKVLKRDGRTETFFDEKIKKAIQCGFSSSEEQADNHELDRLTAIAASEIDQAFEGKIPSVEDVQDIVEDVLMKQGYIHTAKAYILYRRERSRIREMNTKLMSIYEEITYTDSKDSEIKRENANVNADTPMGSMLKYGSEGSKHYYLNFVLPSKIRRAHEEGDIHIHDLDFYTLTTTCCQIEISKLFKGGFSTGHGFLREPQDIFSYSALACIAIQSNQNDQHGGQSIGDFDYGMADGVKKTFRKLYYSNMKKILGFTAKNVDIPYDDFTKSATQKGIIPSINDDFKYIQMEFEFLIEYLDRDRVSEIQGYVVEQTHADIDIKTYQAMEAFIHNLNTMHSRAGAQTPFSSINYGMDTSPEGRLVIKNLLLATESGLGNGETPIFPIQIFRVKDGINSDEADVNYDLFKLACRVSSTRLFPNFSFVDAPFNIQYYKGTKETEIAYMGCRTRVIGNVVDKENESIFGRGNLSFTTINLPRLAIDAKNNIELFYESLDKKMELVLEQLLHRYKIQCQKRVMNFPFLMGQGIWKDSDKLDYNSTLETVLPNGSLSIGFIGLAESLKALVGNHHGESEESQSLGLEIISHMRKYCDKKTEELNLNVTLLATPAEGLAGRFLRMDKKKYGEIAGVTDRDYYTNSFHIPVYHQLSIFKKIDIEAPYHEFTNAGHISYIELDSSIKENQDAFIKIIKYMKSKGVGYGSINHPVDRDTVCGYNGIIGDTCPSCSRDEGDIPFERIRRITGYLVGTVDRFNFAKRQEESERVKHGFKK